MIKHVDFNTLLDVLESYRDRCCGMLGKLSLDEVKREFRSDQAVRAATSIKAALDVQMYKIHRAESVIRLHGGRKVESEHLQHGNERNEELREA